MDVGDTSVDCDAKLKNDPDEAAAPSDGRQ
jgi:hypothetical protein